MNYFIINFIINFIIDFMIKCRPIYRYPSMEGSWSMLSLLNNKLNDLIYCTISYSLSRFNWALTKSNMRKIAKIFEIGNAVDGMIMRLPFRRLRFRHPCANCRGRFSNPFSSGSSCLPVEQRWRGASYSGAKCGAASARTAAASTSLRRERSTKRQ